MWKIRKRREEERRGDHQLPTQDVEGHGGQLEFRLLHGDSLLLFLLSLVLPRFCL
jgi:hypothetical protein